MICDDCLLKFRESEGGEITLFKDVLVIAVRAFVRQRRRFVRRPSFFQLFPIGLNWKTVLVRPNIIFHFNNSSFCWFYSLFTHGRYRTNGQTQKKTLPPTCDDKVLLILKKTHSHWKLSLSTIKGGKRWKWISNKSIFLILIFSPKKKTYCNLYFQSS